MHLTRCTSLDVLHADLLHSVYHALHSVYYAPVYYAIDSLHFNRCINAVYLILCVLDPMYFSEGLCTEEPFAMLSGTLEQSSAESSSPKAADQTLTMFST